MLETINSCQACTAAGERTRAGQGDAEQGAKGSLSLLLPPAGFNKAPPWLSASPGPLPLPVSPLQLVLALGYCCCNISRWLFPHSFPVLGQTEPCQNRVTRWYYTMQINRLIWEVKHSTLTSSQGSSAKAAQASAALRLTSASGPRDQVTSVRSLH